MSSLPSFYTPFSLSLITPFSLSISTPVINSRISNGPIAQPADQTALTGSEQFPSPKPCLHGSSSFIHIPLGDQKKKLLQCLWCFSADKGIVGSEWRGWVDAALMWPRWAELERSAPFPVTVIKALKSTWEIHCIRKSLHYYQCTQCKHLIFMLITKTGWKYGKYINTHASYDCIRQEMIDESGYKWVRFVCAAVGRGMHTNLWFVDCRQHVLNTLPLWIMIWGSRQRKKKRVMIKNQLQEVFFI